MIAKARGGLVNSGKVREGRKHSESVRRGSAIVASVGICVQSQGSSSPCHQLPPFRHLPVQAVLASFGADKPSSCGLNLHSTEAYCGSSLMIQQPPL